MIAAHDKGKSEGDKRKCRGCYQLAHEDASGAWEKGFRDPYALLVGFSVVLCVLWGVTGVLGLIADSPDGGKKYIAASVFSYIMFVIFFAITTDRSRYVRNPYYDCWTLCNASDNWYIKHRNDSYICFWSSSLVCFIIGAYQVGASIVVYNQAFDSPPEKKES
eukprot:TRINITY_DN9525_c0_g3_i3.p1 TRINITY_DN9525_c0_g3~~TRINITY_DN9525_c0_g3_i3.p1  ORF type:complete len:163 (-),score=32.31 TRINITY_DN9525_c0_g3_i3:63-551(-)